ncbi:MAG: 2-oxoglutarate and iron-dependent oxygenase domain-containing protein [Sneathiella sp.]
MSNYIPIVDVSAFKNGSLDQKKKIAKEIRKTAENSGFFYISGHGIAPSLIEQAFATSKRFFALDQGQKSEICVDTNQRGWMAEGLATLEGSKTHDAKEIFFWGWDVAKNDPDNTLPMVAPNLWPNQHAPWLKQDLSPYYLAACDVGGIVMSALALSFDLQEDFFEEAYKKPLARGQLVYYPPFTDKDEASERFSAAPHTDFGVLTLLLQDNNGGLQVRTADGNWIDAPPVDGTLICNIGDLLQRWSNKRLVSTVHRVINRSGRERYSIPIFFDPHSATNIDPCDLGVPKVTSLYEPTTAGEYIAAKNTKNFNHYSKK